MKLNLRLFALVLPVILTLWTGVSTAFAFAFEGQITVTVTRGGQTQTLLYTVGTNQLRIERGENDRPYPKNIVDLDTGNITLLFPNNRSFVRLKPGAQTPSPAPPGFPGMPNPPTVPGMPVPAGAGPQSPVPASTPNTFGPTNLPGMPAMQNPQMPPMPPGVGPQAGSSAPNMPAMPMMMPPMPMEQAELKATAETTNLLGYVCTRYELRQRGEIMEIWATDKLPFQPYLQNQPHRFGPRRIEEQWGGMLKAKRLFPLLAVLRFDRPAAPGSNEPSAPGPERLRFEVTSITPEEITDATLFEPPPDYQELRPLPF